MSELHDLMLDVRDRVIRIEERISIIPEMQKEQDKHGEEILKAKTSVKVLRWFTGILMVTVPATAAAIYKMFN